MTIDELRGRLLLAGYSSLPAWARDHHYAADNVWKTVQRWLGDEPRKIKRKLYSQPKTVPLGRQAREILARLSETIGEEILPGIGRYLPRPADDAAIEAAVQALGGGVERISAEQIERLQHLALRIEHESYMMDQPKDIRGIWQVVREKTGQKSYRFIPAAQFAFVEQYLTEWLAQLRG